MSKKMMLLALAVVSAAFFALPAIASATEIHLEPGNGETFKIAGPGGTLSAEGEPTVTCEGTGGNGSFNAGSSTTGSITLDFTLCHIKVPVFGTTAKCKSETVGGLDNTIASGGTFHLITGEEEIEKGVFKRYPAVLVTTNHTIIVCAGISKITVTGSVIGTITSPECGKSSKEVSLSFTATGNVQNHMEYTGVKYDLQSRTGENPEKTSALVGTSTNSTTNAQTLTCT